MSQNIHLIERLYAFLPMQRLALALAGFSALALGMAFTAQYGFKLAPCALCYMERGPYAATLVLGIIGYFCKRPKVRQIIIGLCGLIFAGGCGLAFYHVGVEQHWWEYSVCAADFDPRDIEALKERLKHPVVPCDEVVWTFFGLSIATINVFTSFGLSVGAFLGLKFSKNI